MPMEAVAEQIHFGGIAPQDIEEFHRQREKILSAVCDKIVHTPGLETLAGDEEKMRLAHESAKIFIENFHATVKYQLPGALLEYLDWLRGFLNSRGFPPAFLPILISAVRTGAHAFLEIYNSDEIGAVLLQFRKREELAAQGVSA
ncbi:MAG: hypothetical protein JXA28_07660 [Bacteroidetes bacterium]|nr:hypothetical protein [Bacteroidota bacterium]